MGGFQEKHKKMREKKKKKRITFLSPDELYLGGGRMRKEPKGLVQPEQAAETAAAAASFLSVTDQSVAFI